MDLSVFPGLNAALNASSFGLLLAGYYFIRRRAVTAHRIAMSAACLCSTVFLVCYLYYHAHHGTTRFTGHGFLRLAYFIILVSHTILAALIVPLILATLFQAVRGRFESHKRVARLTLPLWLYVSVTGVVIYLMLYQMK